MAEIDVKKKMVEENGQRMWDLALGTIFFSVDFSHVQTVVETSSRETHV